MKLLILTQKVDVNDAVLGFFNGWIKEFSLNCELVTVICLEKREYRLPDNVRVFSLGKEEKISRLKYLFRFFKYIWRERKNYDAVFVHMNPEYVVLGGIFWKILGKKIGLWYVHKSVNLKLRIAEKFADFIFTASKESFRLPSKKLVITGHGIDINKFQIRNSEFRIPNSKLKIISVSRISPVKNIHLLIDVADILTNSKNFKNFEINIVGDVVYEKEREYFNELKKKIAENSLSGSVNFLGQVPHKDIAPLYANSDLFVHLSGTGSVDKVVLEAVSSGLPAYSSSEAFEEILPKEWLIPNDPWKIAQKIVEFKKGEQAGSLAVAKAYIEKNHALRTTVAQIIAELRA